MAIIPKHAPHHHIPEEAHCVFSGERADVYQWDQCMFDGTYARFERVRFLDGAFSIAIDTEGKILLTKQEQPGRPLFYSLPGGSFDSPYEGGLACAQRELLEETGYISDDWHEWIRFDGTNNVMTYTYFYIARNALPIQEIQPDRGEKIQLFRVSFDEFLELSSDPGFHHHWNLLPILYDARLYEDKKQQLKKIFYGE